MSHLIVSQGRLAIKQIEQASEVSEGGAQQCLRRAGVSVFSAKM